jgi:hypothetical protein
MAMALVVMRSGIWPEMNLLTGGAQVVLDAPPAES